MTELGYSLSSEEHDPRRLVELAGRAEQAGFSFALISDHFHPWIDRQGHSPFVWSVLGGIAQNTDSLVVGTGVTCPTIRIHPAIIVQAAATTTAMMPGRFFLGWAVARTSTSMCTETDGRRPRRASTCWRRRWK